MRWRNLRESISKPTKIIFYKNNIDRMSTRRLDSFQRFMAFVSPTHSRKCILPRILYWTLRNCLLAFGHLTLPIKDLDRYGCLTIELDVTSVHLGCVVHKGEITWFQDNCPAVLFNKISLFTSYDIYYVRQQYIKSIATYQHRHSDWHWHKHQLALRIYVRGCTYIT